MYNATALLIKKIFFDRKVFDNTLPLPARAGGLFATPHNHERNYQRS